MDVASGIIVGVLGKLSSAVMDEVRSQRGVGEELQKLESKLSAIRSALADAEARQVKGEALKDWLKKLKDVAYDIDDVLDEAAAAALEQHKPGDRQFGCKGMVRKCLSLSRSLKFRHEIAEKILKIHKRFDEISKEKTDLQLREAPVEHSEPEGNMMQRETDSYVSQSEVYGRDEDKKTVIDFLLNQFCERNLAVLSIVGLGGLGKTTLAKLVYNDDEQVSKHFDSRIWVYVSEKFVIKNVITEIITKLKPADNETDKDVPSDLDSMGKELLKRIKDKRFLLVLDDVWNENYQRWEDLEKFLKNGAKGSKVIVTTRNKRVAQVMNSAKELPLCLLSKDECWKVFESRAFESSVVKAGNYNNLVDIGREIVEKCRGLPLAAKVLGSVMRSKKEEGQWRAIRDNEIWKIFENNIDIIPALMLSYNHLEPRLKQCFAYCSIFPKGTDIDVEMLVQMWVAEGFIIDSSSSSEYVDQLISRSLLDEEGDTVKMHDMVHNLAQFVAGDECSIVYGASGSTRSVSQNSRYISIVDEAMASPPALIPSISSGYKLRTFRLIIVKSHFIEDNNSRNYFEGEDICQKLLDSIVSSMKLLRVLHLRGLAIKELPNTMKVLVHLRYLNLSKTNLNSFPQTICKLVYLQHLDLSRTELLTLAPSVGTLRNLQILDLSYCRKLEEIPDSIGGLTNLLKLRLNGCTNLNFLPDTISKLVHLQSLDLSGINLQALPPNISHLRNLQRLNLSYCEKLEEIPDSICGSLKNLSILNLSDCKSLHSLPDSIGCIRNLQVLNISGLDALDALPESLSSLYNLQKLKLSYCSGLRELPKNIQSMRSLTNLDIFGCDRLTSVPKGIRQMSQLQKLPMYVLGDGENDACLADLGTLMNLKGLLYIKNLQNVKDVAEATAANLRERQSISLLRLGWDFDANGWERKYESIEDFESKRKAIIERVAAMDAEHIKLLEDVLSSLQPHQNLPSLQIYSYIGKVLPGWMMDLSNLVDLQLRAFARCDDLKALEKLSCLENLLLYGFPSVECLPQLGQLPRLRVLELYMLTGVKRLGAELYGGAGAFPVLRCLALGFMLGLEEWSETENGNYEEGGNDFLSHLWLLELRYCPKLQALPSTFPSVKELTMNEDDELMLSCVERGAFPNLRHLILDNCKDCEDESSLSLPEVVQRLNHKGTSKSKRRMKWNHSELELEKMRVDTLREIAREIDNKMAI